MIMNMYMYIAPGQGQKTSDDKIILHMYIAPGQGQITSDDKISMLIKSFYYFDHFCEVSS